MSDRVRLNRRESVLIIFPEVFGAVAACVATPIILVGLFQSGRILIGVAGLLAWMIATAFGVYFVRCRRFGLALLPLVAVFGICLLLLRVSGQ